jgi:hypothetical protein
MDLVILFETIMLLCFAASWPVSIYKSIKSRTAKGKSGLFVFLVFLGYIAGISKCILDSGLENFLLIPYTFNFFIVCMDFVLYFRNCKLDKIRDAEEKK